VTSMRMYLTLCPILLCALSAVGQTAAEASPTAKDIVARLAENNQRRGQLLLSYTGQREYHLLYTGFPGRREANMVVEVKYQAPASKEFTVVSQSGSTFIINRVFKKLLETEKEAADQKGQTHTALTEQNYSFELLGEEELDGRPSYVLKVEPRTDNKLLYRGQIWVDAADYAVARVEAEPAKRPSFWISKTVIHHTYRKVGEFWLPAQNESSSDVRLGGHARLSISYGEYKVSAASAYPLSRTARDLKDLPITAESVCCPQKPIRREN